MTKGTPRFDIIFPSATGCDDAPEFDYAQFLESYEDCDECNKICWRITNCEDPQDFLCISSDSMNLSIYNNKVISYLDPNDNTTKCGTVVQTLCRDLEQQCDIIPLVITIIDCYDDCEACLYVPPLEEYDFSQRTVHPGYNTPACSTEVWDKTKCKWSESLYQQMATNRYGIEFCCDPADQKWHIKNELIELAAIYDESVCAYIAPPAPEPECETTCVIFDCTGMSYTALEQFMGNGSTNWGIKTLNAIEAESGNTAYYAILQQVYDCFINQKFNACFTGGKDICEEKLVYILNNLQECTAKVNEEYKTNAQTWPQLADIQVEFVAFANELQMLLQDAVKVMNETNVCPEYLTGTEVTYVSCEGNIVTVPYSQTQFLPGISIQAGSTLEFSNPLYEGTEEDFITYLSPLYSKTTCEEVPDEPCNCTYIIFYNLHGEQTGSVTGVDCGNKQISVDVGPRSAVIYCAAQDQLSASNITEIDTTDTECCEPSTAPPCCKTMWAYGGASGGNITYQDCSFETVQLTLQTLEWQQITINLCADYQLDQGMIIDTGGPA
jgi:hypothetical protein